MDYKLGSQKENPNTWSARDRSREASNDYYEKTPLMNGVPLTGYDRGEVATHTDDYTKIESSTGMQDSEYSKVKADSFDGMSTQQDVWPKGIKSEDSMDGHLLDANPQYKSKL